MANKKQKRTNFNDTISASEIGQYNYCSVAWYLGRLGYEPDSPYLEIGTKKHNDLGIIINKTQANKKKSNVFAILGYILMFLAILYILFEVI